MHQLKAHLVLFAAIALLALPSAARAEDLLPPGNSAVNQYTESFPTSKGQKKTKRGGDSQDKSKDRSPGEVLGPRNARRLETEGAAGQQLAAVVAATAPASAARSANGEKRGGLRADVGSSSPLTEAIKQAGGSSDSGGMGIALPLLLLAAVVGFGLYAWRRRATA